MNPRHIQIARWHAARASRNHLDGPDLLLAFLFLSWLFLGPIIAQLLKN